MVLDKFRVYLMVNDEIVYVPFVKAIKNDKPINRELLNTLRRLSI